MSQEDRMETRLPDPKKVGVNNVRWKYEAARGAILDAVPETPPGLPFKDFPACLL